MNGFWIRCSGTRVVHFGCAMAWFACVSALDAQAPAGLQPVAVPQAEPPPEVDPAIAWQPRCDRGQDVDLATANKKQLADVVSEAKKERDNQRRRRETTKRDVANKESAWSRNQSDVTLQRDLRSANKMDVEAKFALDCADAKLAAAKHELAVLKAADDAKTVDAVLEIAGKERIEAEASAPDDKQNAQDHMKKARAKVTEVKRSAEKLRQQLEGLRKQLEHENGRRDALVALITRLDTRRSDGITLTSAQDVRGELAALDVCKLSLEQSIVALEPIVRDLEAHVADAEKQNESLSDAALQRIALKNGDDIQYGVTLAAARLRVTRSAAELARVRDYQPEAEFVPSLIGFRVVYGPSVPPWRIKTTGEPLQLMSVEFALYIEKANGNALGAVSIGVGLTLVNGLIGVGLGFDVYRAVPVRDGTARIGIVPWALSRKGEVTAENVALMLTLGLDTLVKKLSGSTNEPEGGGKS